MGSDLCRHNAHQVGGHRLLTPEALDRSFCGFFAGFPGFRLTREIFRVYETLKVLFPRAPRPEGVIRTCLHSASLHLCVESRPFLRALCKARQSFPEAPQSDTSRECALPPTRFRLRSRLTSTTAARDESQPRHQLFLTSGQVRKPIERMSSKPQTSTTGCCLAIQNVTRSS